jgi:hypothetical protein
MNGSQDTTVTFSYLHLVVPKPLPVNMITGPSQSVGYCFDVNSGDTGANAHLHLEIEICDNLSSGESLARMQAKYPASLTPGTIPFRPGQLSKGGGTGGRNCYLVHPNIFVKGAMSFTGTEAAGFSAVATNFKNFGILDVGFLLVVVICIVSLQISKQAQRFTSGQGMGVFMKALGQMITGVIQALGSMVGVGAKAAEMAAPLAGSAMGAAAGAAGQVLERTGLDRAVNRTAEGVQKTFDNVTQQLAGTLENAGFNVGSMLSGAQRSLSNTQQEVIERVAEFEQGIRDLAAGIQSRESVQRVMKMLAPGVAVLTFATNNFFVPTAASAAWNTATIAGRTFDPFDDLGLSDVNLAGELQNARENLAKAPLSEAPARDAATRATPAVEQQQGGWVPVENTNPQNDYAVLGVREGATLEEMRAALRQKGRELHPDINPNGGDQFREVTAAFGRLKSRGDVQAATPQEITPETTRALSGTTFAPIPRGQTEDSRAAEDSSRRDSVAASREALENDRESLEAKYNYPSYQKDGDNADSDEDKDKDTPSFDSRPKEKTEDPRSSVSPARSTSEKKESPAEKERKARQRAASVAGDGVSANDILASTGIDATEAEMRAAKNNIIRFKRAATPTPTSPKSRR